MAFVLCYGAGAIFATLAAFAHRLDHPMQPKDRRFFAYCALAALWGILGVLHEINGKLACAVPTATSGTAQS